METKKHRTPSKSNPLLTDLVEWVVEFFTNNKDVETKGFNVHSYPTKEKEDALLTLTARGYTCLLENNGNNLSVSV